MIRARIQIEDGELYDITDQFGFIYINGDKMFSAPIKEFEKTSYPEQAGYNIYPKTVDDGFEYKVNLFIKADTISRANNKILSFNNRLYSKSGDVKTFKRVTFYDDYKNVKIVGYPKPISEATDFYRDKNNSQFDIVCCDFIIEVNNPNLCDFDTNDLFVSQGSVIFTDNMDADFDVIENTLHVFDSYNVKSNANISNNQLTINQS